MRGIISTLAIVWRIASPYFRSEDRWPGRLLLAAVIAIELSIVGITVLINEWNARFYNALQDRNWNAFVYQLGYFCVLATIFILLAVYQLYLNQWLQIRWRRWLTSRYLDHWMEGANHYRMQLVGRRRRQSGPAHFRGHRAVHPIDLGHRPATAQFLRHAVLVHGHPVVTVGGGAVARVRARLQYSRLPVMGGVDLCLHRHSTHASDRPPV